MLLQLFLYLILRRRNHSPNCKPRSGVTEVSYLTWIGCPPGFNLAQKPIFIEPFPYTCSAYEIGIKDGKEVMAEHTTGGGSGHIEKAKGGGNVVDFIDSYFCIEEEAGEFSTCFLRFSQRRAGGHDGRWLVASRVEVGAEGYEGEDVGMSS